MKFIPRVLSLLVLTLSLSACGFLNRQVPGLGLPESSNASSSQIGAATGAILGGGVGAVIGSLGGNTGGGLAIGAVTGAAAGGIVGSEFDSQSEDQKRLELEKMALEENKYELEQLRLRVRDLEADISRKSEIIQNQEQKLSFGDAGSGRSTAKLSNAEIEAWDAGSAEPNLSASSAKASALPEARSAGFETGDIEKSESVVLGDDLLPAIKPAGAAHSEQVATSQVESPKPISISQERSEDFSNSLPPAEAARLPVSEGLANESFSGENLSSVEVETPPDLNAVELASSQSSARGRLASGVSLEDIPTRMRRAEAEPLSLDDFQPASLQAVAPKSLKKASTQAASVRTSAPEVSSFEKVGDSFSSDSEKSATPPVKKLGKTTNQLVVEESKKPVEVAKSVQADKLDKSEWEERGACQEAEKEAEIGRDSSTHADKLYYFRRALRLCPDSPKYHFEIGKVFGAMGRKEDAEFEFLRALELDPRNAAAMMELDRLQAN